MKQMDAETRHNREHSGLSSRENIQWKIPWTHIPITYFVLLNTNNPNCLWMKWNCRLKMSSNLCHLHPPVTLLSVRGQCGEGIVRTEPAFPLDTKQTCGPCLCVSSNCQRLTSQSFQMMPPDSIEDSGAQSGTGMDQEEVVGCWYRRRVGYL